MIDNWDNILDKCLQLFYALPDGAHVAIEIDQGDFQELLTQRMSNPNGKSITLFRRDGSMQTKIHIKPRKVLH